VGCAVEAPGPAGLMERLEAAAAEVAAGWSGAPAGPGAISGDDLVRLRRAVNRLEAAFTGGVGLFDRGREWSAEGAVSAAAWLRRHCGLSAPESHQRVKVSRALGRMPTTREAFESGEISYAHVRVMAAPVDEHTEEAFRGVEESMVGVARECSPTELRRVVEYWRMNLDADGGAGVANGRYGRRRLHVSQTFAGMVAIDGILDPVSAETVRRWACDAAISRVVTGARGEPLDVGRRQRSVTGAQRRAIVVRDGGCRFPGCDRPPGWCVPHHLRHWADGGPTDLGNLLLLCHRHHRLVHEGRWEIEVDGGGRVATRSPEAARARGPGDCVAA